MRKTYPTATRQEAFTLVEMAVVLLILTLLASGLTVGLSGHLARRAERATDDALAETRDALVGYALRHGRFPCPARGPNDGSEDRGSSTCNKTRGLIPWTTLGIAGTDGWDNRLHYAITERYTRQLSEMLQGNLTNMIDGQLEVRTRSLDGSEQSLTTQGGMTPLVILSHGANGLGATSREGQRRLAATAGSDEAHNAAASGTLFYSRTPSENPEAPGSTFDDRVSWLSPNLLAHRLIGTGHLP
ncbi:type II secretion system protein [Zoogloea sp.]|uniref:type II secretion system protein n=1 Tax=Zoogloea sp. TaxID=49181 RepID=UPI00260DCE6D|nr:type II secretion system protein [Zoogloea sp.]MDD3354941.1 type II secretion system protein [Zoogloea sp.]